MAILYLSPAVGGTAIPIRRTVHSPRFECLNMLFNFAMLLQHFFETFIGPGTKPCTSLPLYPCSIWGPIYEIRHLPSLEHAATLPPTPCQHQMVCSTFHLLQYSTIL